MCDGDFDGGFSDPDYDDLEFRRYNPSVLHNRYKPMNNFTRNI